MSPDDAESTGAAPADVHTKIGQLTRQLHDSLNALGYAEKLRDSVGELPDAKSRLSYIARLTGEAAEKVLNRVDQAKTQHAYIADETRRMVTELVKDPVAAVATGQIMNFLTDMERVTKEADDHLTEIMMAQDFHDLTGQVIARVVSLAATIEDQLVQLLIQTAPPGSAPPAAAAAATAATAAAATAAAATATAVDDGELPPMPPVPTPKLQGPVVDPENASDVVTNQSEVDDLLASLGF
ncbi:protein phosphatase CheZ [Xylophilus ampelinus]|uniref:Protein phosphatase CheZ n=1 Tax=Xylophilus ampelinus TaxID=54067 RepID=A0A318SFJ3_9BURK|nr:protein phosphatase CheZ [Xylophilus ampelinus]MCS4511214.1 protein phosphatase CheZ [Xylophilus ampelinus]PYE75031.1 chemotaxis phosphatase CheZ [Xylophilus ampelinus]